MGLQKLSTNVNKRANQSIIRTIFGLCLLAGIIVLGLIVSNTNKDNVKQVKLYSAQVDITMAEKTSFINTVAAGISSGSVTGDYHAYVDQMVEQYGDVSAVYVCLKESGVKYKDGIMTYMSGGWIPPEDFVVSERSWYQGAAGMDGVYVSEPYVDEQSGGICITLSKAIYQGGNLIGVAGMDMYMDDLVGLIESSYQGGNYVFLVSNEGTILTHPNEKFALSTDTSSTVAEALKGKYESVCANALKNKVLFDYSGGLKMAISHPSEITGWNVVSVTTLNSVIITLIIIIVLGIGLGIVIGKIAKRSLLNGIGPMFTPLEELASNISKISEGKLDYSFEVDDQSQEVYSLSVALNNTMKELQHYITEITNTVTAISEKNLDFTVDGEYTGDYENIKIALTNILQVLNESFSQINEQADTVLHYSENLSDTSEAVADAATAQSASVQSASDEMKKLTENMEQIVSYAVSIKENTDTTNESLNNGKQEMDELVEAMDEIVNCYDEIAGFVSEIENIASQTGLLSLNASIEAARAGEAGRGFAVVASEISTLSDSSSQSSARISAIIEKSMDAVAKGKELVKTTEQAIQDSVRCSEENTAMVNEIVTFVETQKTSAGEISNSLREISEMVENNAASAQENSAISTHLGECAKSLMDTIAQFRLHQ
ncbi:MAG: methyl-accepting chemotaxis protein [Lachnospiraceae bacterium]